MAFEAYKSFVRTRGVGGDAIVAEGHELNDLAERVARLYNDPENIDAYLSQPPDELAAQYAMLGPDDALREAVHGYDPAKSERKENSGHGGAAWRECEHRRKGLGDGPRGNPVFAKRVSHKLLVVMASQAMDSGAATEEYARICKSYADRQASLAAAAADSKMEAPTAKPVSRYFVDQLRAKYGIEWNS